MSYEDMARSHVERCLQDIWELSRVEVDLDGDYPFRTETCAGWVRLEPQPPLLVRVFSHVAYGVKQTAALLREINTINQRARFAIVTWDAGVVSVHSAVPACALDRTSLRLALDAVARVAGDIGELTTTVFGGQLPARPLEGTG